MKVFEMQIYFSLLFLREKPILNRLFPAQLQLCLMFILLSISSGEVFSQTYWGASGGSILNVDTGESFTGAGALTLAHDDPDTQAGHTLMFMPAGLDIFSTDVFDTDHDYTSITKEITVDGNGASVFNDNFGSNTSKALWLQPGVGETQTVRNITLCGFTHTDGSAIGSTYNTDSKLILENVNVYFSGNNSYQVWMEGNCDIINCDFSNVQQTSNTGGLYIKLKGKPNTVNIINSTFNCNRKVGYGTSVAIESKQEPSHYLHTVNITGGSISNNIGTNAALYLGTGKGSVITIDGMEFINNDVSGGSTPDASAIYLVRASSPSQNLFLNNSNYSESG